MQTLIWVLLALGAVLLAISILQRLFKLALVAVVVGFLGLVGYYLVLDHAPEPVVGAVQRAAEGMGEAGKKLGQAAAEKGKEAAEELAPKARELAEKGIEAASDATKQAGSRIAEEAEALDARRRAEVAEAEADK